MADENIGEIYVKIRADVSNLDREVQQLKARLSKDAAEMGNKLSFKAKFDNSIAVWRISELQKLREKLQREFDKKVSIDVSSTSLDRTREKIAAVDARLKGVGETAQSLGNKLITGFAALGGMAAFFRIMKDSIVAAKESAIAQAQITKAVETTGQASGFTAKELIKMAKELQNLNAIDDDKILANITNQLLTFRNISGDVFKRTQQAVLDLNAVSGKGNLESLTNETIRLGEALQEPVMGTMQLMKAGVIFSMQQKEQIKKLAESNKLFEAQSLVLDVVEGQYGGQAEALAKATGGTQQFSVAIGNLLEKLGAPLLSVLGKVATAITSLLDPVENVNEGFTEQKSAFDNLQKSITPLLSRYDELKSKTSLNKSEQDELKTIILRVAGAIPSAISALNDYGVATDINRGKVEEFIKTEQKRLAVVNKSDIEAYNKKKKLAEQSKKLVEDELKRSLESGKKTVQFSTAQGVIEREVKVSDKDLKSAQQKIKAFQDEIDGYNAELDLLSGKVDKVKPVVPGKVVMNTMAGDEVLKQYKEQQEAIEQIRNKLAQVDEVTGKQTVQGKERVALQKELNSLIEKQKDKTVKTTFETKIPKDYTANQVAEYEALKFAAKGYADYALAVIEMKYTQELAAAKTNTQEKLKAEENYNLGIAKLNQEILDDDKKKNDKELEDAKKIGDKILDDTKKNNEKLNAEAEKSIEDKKTALEKYYDSVQFADESYLKFRIVKIKEEAEIIKQSTGNNANSKLLSEKYIIEESRKLYEEQLDWQIKHYAREHKVEMAALDSLKEGFVQAFQLIKIRTSQSASALENIFVDMANSFIAQVERMIAEWAAFQLLKGIAGVIFAPVTGGASLIPSIPLFHKGGEVLGTSTGIKKLASGGSFMVPQGFPNDSYPMLVESGERISVTPTNKVQEQDKSLAILGRKLDILNANLVGKNFAPSLSVRTEIDGKEITKSVVSNINRMEKEGRRLNHL